MTEVSTMDSSWLVLIFNGSWMVMELVVLVVMVHGICVADWIRHVEFAVKRFYVGGRSIFTSFRLVGYLLVKFIVRLLRLRGWVFERMKL